uniref:Glucose-methanol-choline oxidoreductase N-terminal domain-containing protein n=1 Tax=Timema bartmani TaxID=61472 RepID=A0A7R9I7M4_9NEOP|nr:unnamed protein product [Timema bartmani]
MKNEFISYYIVIAKKEVILSAVAINPPQLLMLSGIGPKTVLDDFGIALILDLKVGFNLHDHVTSSGVEFILNENTQSRCLQHISDIFEYLLSSTGPLDTTEVSETIAFDYVQSPNEALQYILVGVGVIPQSDASLTKEGNPLSRAAPAVHVYLYAIANKYPRGTIL